MLLRFDDRVITSHTAYSTVEYEFVFCSIDYLNKRFRDNLIRRC